MCRRSMKGLLWAGAIAASVALTGTEAWAGCTQYRSIGGSSYCVAWSTGSEVCNEIIKGYGGVGTCNGAPCGVAECTAYGTVEVGLGGTCDTDTQNLDPLCGIAGIAFCVNPAGNSSHAQGQPFTLPGAEGPIPGSITCDKKGKCTASVELDPTDTSNICINSNWQLLTFTASEFKGKACFCPGGYDATHTCCADSERTAGLCGTPYGVAPTLGTPICFQEYCHVDLSTYKPGFSIPYTCENTFTCGGVTGVPCN